MSANMLPSVLNAIPEGLLSLLQLKQTGRNPSALVEYVQPTLDLVQWYAAATSEVVVSSVFTRASVGSTMSDLGVPNDQTWLVDQLTMLVSPAAGVTTCRAQLTVQNSNAAGTFQLYASPIIDVGPSGQAFVSLTDRPLLLRPGDLFGMQLVAYAGAGNVTSQVQGRIARLLL